MPPSSVGCWDQFKSPHLAKCNIKTKEFLQELIYTVTGGEVYAEGGAGEVDEEEVREMNWGGESGSGGGEEAAVDTA